MANIKAKTEEQAEKNKNKKKVELEASDKTIPVGQEEEQKVPIHADDFDGDRIQLSKDDFEKVKNHIEAMQREKDEAIAVAQRLQADFDNYRKRNASLRLDSNEEGKRDCMKALLPVIDNFDRALENAQGVQEGFLEGMRLVRRMLLETLGQFGLKEIEAVGIFDPNLHHAAMQEAEDGKESGEILEILQKGYEANGKILRHSVVKVAE